MIVTNKEHYNNVRGGGSGIGIREVVPNLKSVLRDKVTVESW